MYSSPSTTRISRFARRSNGAVNYTSTRDALDLNQLQDLAPSVFAEGAHASRSRQYSYIPTSEVLAGLMREGFRPYAVMQGGSRDVEKRGFTKHLIRLRHDSQGLQVGGTHNEIVLMNSHDGTSSYRLMAGVFRLICGNGLVVAESMVEDIRIPHKGDITGQVIDGCVELLTKLPQLSESVREMESLRLTEGERAAFATAALVARYDEGEAPITPSQLLTPRRTEDVAPTLWNTLNVAQEGLIRGGLSYIQRDTNGRRVARRRTREIGGIDQNTTVNRALWTLAEEMRKLKATV
ncbi:DUF932 domain-containing protein [Prosthecobacter sp.]|uniref:DUF932 domain-containing protein n=1 Tax=Prosthecobacter sp. TaxID=1965333 RepID=UPI003783C37E